MLVALGARGTERIDYDGCRNGRGGAPLEAQVVILAVCSGRGSLRFTDTAVPCDGRTHEVWTGRLNFRADAFDVTAVPDPSTGRTSLSVQPAVAAS